MKLVLSDLYIYFFLLCLPFLGCGSRSATVNASPPHVLIYSKTKAFRHECIGPGSAALQSYFKEKGITSTFSEDSSLFTASGLKGFDVVMFFQTTGNVLDSMQQIAFENFIKSGKGYVGVHAAADTEYEWPWYGKLVGAYYSSHPDIQSAAIQKVDTSHISCKHIPDRWTRTDEWYNFKEAPRDVTVILTIDESTYQGGTMGINHPMSWCHTYDGGRAFYTALGHTVESYSDTMFLEHVRQGVLWVSAK
jgi:type 1 glutamine amidotransferase